MPESLTNSKVAMNKTEKYKIKQNSTMKVTKKGFKKLIEIDTDDYLTKNYYSINWY